MQKQLVNILIPIYKEELTSDEYTSLRQCLSILSKYPITLVCPKSLNLDNYFAEFAEFKVEVFEDRFFESIEGYNKLLMSMQFYRRFLNFEFILIYQLDAFVFRDELEYWCKLNFDYIGAPWLNFKTGNPNFVGVGNGGFSLRNTKNLLNYLDSETIKMNFKGVYRLYSNYSFLKKIIRLSKILFSQVGYKNNKVYFTEGGLNEDYFFGYISQYSKNRLKIPSAKIAMQFAFDEHPEELLKLNNFDLPFGCHGWYKNKKAKKFWEQYMEK